MLWLGQAFQWMYRLRRCLAEKRGWDRSSVAKGLEDLSEGSIFRNLQVGKWFMINGFYEYHEVSKAAKCLWNQDTFKNRRLLKKDKLHFWSPASRGRCHMLLFFLRALQAHEWPRISVLKNLAGFCSWWGTIQMACDPWVEAGTDVDVSFDFVSHETVTPVYPVPVVLKCAFSCSKNDTHRNWKTCMCKCFLNHNFPQSHDVWRGRMRLQ